MGLIKLLIVLDQPVYYSGQTVSGRLLVEVDKPMSMRGIYLKYSGRATVLWTETVTISNQNHIVTYSNVENYLELQQLVFGNDDEDCELAEGEHVFVFNFELPMNSPSSFEGMYGRIRYSVKATINRSWKFNHVARQPLTVVSICDLNHFPLAVTPVAERISKTFWGQYKPLDMSVNLPVRGFVSGQIMPIKVFLNNESEVQVKTLCVTLEQHIKVYAADTTKTDKTRIFKNEFPVPEGLGCKEVPLNLQLPALPPSYLEFCKIIDLNYHLKVTARVDSWYHRNLSLRLELIVGNIPLMSYQRPIPVSQLLYEPIDKEKPSYSQASYYQPPVYGFAIPIEMMYEDLPPPTYEQSVQMGTGEKKNPENDPDGDGKLTEFFPLYPVYKFEDSQGFPKKSED